MSNLNILIVDDHPLIRNGIENALKSISRDYLILHANDGSEAIEVFKNNKVDFILMDVLMEGLDGVETTSRIREINSKVKIVGLSSYDDIFSVINMLEAGVNGYSLKYIAAAELKNIFETVMNGGLYISPEIVPHLEKYRKYKEGLNSTLPKPELSEREIRVLVLICQQLSNKEIATKLKISVRTVEQHRAHILEKTISKNNIGLMLYAIHKRFIKVY